MKQTLYTGDKIESILKITTVHCVTRVVAQKTRFNNICKFPRNNPIQNPPFSFSNAQTSTKLDADFRLIYWMDYELSIQQGCRKVKKFGGDSSKGWAEFALLVWNRVN